MILTAFPLEGQEVRGPDGLQRGVVWLPIKAQILHLGVAYPTMVICIFALVPPLAKDKNGFDIPYAKTDLRMLEFIIGVPGNAIPHDYIFRAPIRTKAEDGTESIIFLFEKKAGGLIVV